MAALRDLMYEGTGLRPEEGFGQLRLWKKQEWRPASEDDKKKLEPERAKINIEAAREVARQLRLRNLSGIIIVDFINQNNDKDYEELSSVIRHELSKDSLKTSLIDFTSLGLAEITREKRHSSIYDIVRYSNM